MSHFRLKVMLFMIPLLLPIGRVEITGEAQSGIDRTPPPSFEVFEAPALQPEPIFERADDLAVNHEPASMTP